MFESADMTHKVSRKDYDARVPGLREELLAAQYDLLERGQRAVLIIVAGVDGAGKGDTVNLLNAWLDPRHVRTHGFGPRTDGDAERPPYYRFWRRLAPRGESAIFFGSWYSAPMEACRGEYQETASSRMSTSRSTPATCTVVKAVASSLW